MLTVNLSARRKFIFSPIVATKRVISSWTVGDSPTNGEANKVSLSAELEAAIAQTWFIMLTNRSFLAEKSVSELISTTAPAFPSAVTATPTRPLDAVLDAFLATAAKPFF